MLKTKSEKRSGIGVIVGRFQVPELTEGHRDLLDSVVERHDAVMIVLGLAVIKASKNNPLDFESRRHLIQSTYPNIKVMYLHDNPSDQVWVKSLDDLIRMSAPATSIVTLYGSRNSFLETYKKQNGSFNNEELEPDKIASGTKIREITGVAVKGSEDFRRGVIWATQNQYDKIFSTVDIAAYKLNNDKKIDKILFAKKNIDGGLLRFIGGFVEPNYDDQGKGTYLEDQARKELEEEASVSIKGLHYLGSFLINDWRYRAEKDKIVTILFIGEIGGEVPIAGDDVDGLEWITVNQLDGYDFIITRVVDIHQKLIHAVKRFVKMYNNEGVVL
jgi:bifunctional NMN adenylyltransferase/nudix hydrolase